MDRWLERDVTIRVLSVVLALAMWFQVTGEQNPLVTRTFQSVTIKAQNLKEGLVLMELAPKTISATVQGQRRTISTLKEEDVVAFVDLDGFGAGKTSLPVSFSLPRSVELVESLPGQVDVMTDTSSSKKVRVEVRSMGAPADEYMALAGKATVADATVEGPRSRVTLVARAVADVDVTGSSADIVRDVKLRALDVDGQEVQDVRVLPTSVEATVPMRRLPPAKTVSVKVDIQGPPKAGYRVESVVTEPLSVRIRGPQEVLDKIDTISSRQLDVRGVASDFDRQVDLVLPAGISLVEPKSVLARVSIVEDRIEKTITRVPIQIKHVSGVFIATVTPTEMSVTVEGLRAAVDKLAAKNIEVSVDLLGLPEGQHGVSIQVAVPEGISLVGTSQDVVMVTIRKK